MHWFILSPMRCKTPKYYLIFNFNNEAAAAAADTTTITTTTLVLLLLLLTSATSFCMTLRWSSAVNVSEHGRLFSTALSSIGPSISDEAAAADVVWSL